MSKKGNSEFKRKVINGKYQIVKKIGRGSFGDCFLCVHKRTKKPYALKIESGNTQFLLREAQILQYLNEKKPKSTFVGIPKVKYFGKHEEKSVLIISLLGASLEDLFKFCDSKFSMKTTLLLFDQALELIEYVHSLKLLHRDIKPANFLLGFNSQAHKLFLIDFGLAKQYVNPVCSVDKYGKKVTKNYHIPFNKSKQGITGTLRYCSLNCMNGFELSRRDDLESIGYMMIFFLKNALPWSGLKKVDLIKKIRKIHKIKANTSLEVLCEGLPSEFIAYFKYVRNLQFDEKPNYTALRKMFRKLFSKLKYKKDYKYDWITKLESLEEGSCKKCFEDLRESFRNIQKKSEKKSSFFQCFTSIT